jgi:predicted DNA-binding transcriptional regulator YafY
MANTSTRTLRLLSLLQTHRYWPGSELAERLGVSVRTLRRDIDRLRELGYPVEAQRGVDGGYELAAGAALPPLVIDNEEAVALAVGLQAAAQDAVEDIAESSVRALAKVVQVMLAASTAHPLIGTSVRRRRGDDLPDAKRSTRESRV